MSDSLITYYRSTLPAELAAALAPPLDSLEKGDFLAVFEHPLAQLLLGHQDNEATRDIHRQDYPVWSDYVFRRLNAILSQAPADSTETTTESPAYRQNLFFILALAALHAFLQSNCTGPPLPFSSASIVLGSALSSDTNAVSALRKKLIASLSADGVAIYRLTPNIELFSLTDTILSCAAITEGRSPAATWARFRTDLLHQRLLSEIAPSLQTAIYGHIDALDAQVWGDQTLPKEVRVSYLLERAAAHTHHGFDKRARADLDLAATERGFAFALTGLLGKRTRFQMKDTSQLVVLARSAEDTVGVEERVDEGEGQKEEQARPKNLDLNDDTLLESISFTEKTAQSSTEVKEDSALPATLRSLDPSDQPMLAPLDSAILLLLASSITNTSPADGLTREETLPYATRVLEGGSSNWQVYTQALLVRSRIEGYRSRTAERGLLQLQALVDQVIADTTPDASTAPKQDDQAPTSFLPRTKESEAAPVHERLQYVFQLCTPLRWELEAELASRWVSVGGLRSALEIYERLEMWAEAALCWAATEREDKARRMVRKQLFHATNGDDDETANDDEETWEGPARDPPPADAPRLYCILGDIDKEPSWYEKAWEVSNSRYARAQRSLGRYYFAAKDHQRAANAYRLSLTVNQLNEASWFAFGCALLELGHFSRAAEAFSRAVQLDDSDAEAWSNLAAALLHMDPDDDDREETDAPPSAPALADDDDDDVIAAAASRPRRDPQKRTRDALEALKHAARLKYDHHRIWENVLTVAATLNPPSFADIIVAQRRIIELRGAVDGERCVDANVLDALTRHVVASAEDAGYDPAKPGIPRLLVELVDRHVVPLITAQARLWTVVARLALWRGRPGTALECQEKAWRATVNKPGWEVGEEREWEEVVEATVGLVDAYESLGPRERTEGMAAGSGELVARDWRFKARSVVRGVMGRGRGSWEGTAGWERLAGRLEGLKS